MTKKIADKGATEAFLRKHVNYSGKRCLIWPFHRNRAGYGIAVVSGKQGIASRLMCEMVHGKAPSPAHDAAHDCGKGQRGCIHPGHVQWKTKKQNSADKLLHGTMNHGERNGRTTLTARDIRAIRAAPPDLIALMKKYGVSKGCVSKIRSGSRWGHL